MGLLLVQDPFAPQMDNVNVDRSNAFDSSLFPVALFDFSAGSPGFGTLNIAGYSYATHNTIGAGGKSTFLASTEQYAVDQVDALNAYRGLFGISNTYSTSYVTGWTASGSDTNFYVGTTVGGNALSINTAVTNSASGDTVHVGSGTYVEQVCSTSQEPVGDRRGRRLDNQSTPPRPATASR